jgi:hypothetical protein|tara:strand:- start:236 stop:466 length:231 start_codon:yes stop_codon:yes gene_type:complete
MLAITLTFSALFSIMFLLVGGLVGWVAKQQVYETTNLAYTHPEMFDENGNIFPDEILAVRFENDYDINTAEEDDED